jgi:putative ABC transport system permease protein
MLTDLRDALRQLRKAPGFTTTAVITLALGIGATTAIFTLIHQVMLKSLPVVKPEELWRIGDKIRCCNWGGYTQGEDENFSLFSWEAYKNFRARTPEFTDLAALQAGNAPLGVRRAGSQAAADTRNGEYVSGNFFRTLGVQPWIGRLMTDADDQEGAPPVAVMSYRIWKGKYGSDPSVVGASYQINGHPFTVIGVAAPGFYGAKLAGGGMPDFWLPLTTELMIDGATARLKRPNGNFLDIIGRVRPGVNPKLLEAELKVELHNWLASHVPDMEPGEKQLWQQQTLHLTPGGAGVAAMRDQYQDWPQAVAGGGRVCAAGGLRQSSESDAGAWVERPRADIHTHGAGSFSAATGAQGVGGVRAVVIHWRSHRCRGGLWRNEADAVSGLSSGRSQ